MSIEVVAALFIGSAAAWHTRKEQQWHDKHQKGSAMAWMKVKCGHCGQDADIDAWTSTLIYGELPPGRYQCPHCGTAFKRQIGPSEVWNGRIIPGKVKLVPVEGRM